MKLGRTIHGVFIDYTEFISSHGRSPRGRSGWAFFWKPDSPATEAFWHVGTLREACKAAAADARAAGVTRIWLGS